LSVGGDEDAMDTKETLAQLDSSDGSADAPGPSYFRMMDNVDALATSLASRRYPSLRLQRTVLAGEGHNSTIGAAVSRGLRALSATDRPLAQPRAPEPR
jgi:hypothetical protein